ncbi:S-methyl-5-thioribose-1-phosphate isomerase [Irineochytrium annulatum]|nr:S-methyl-5-thioribose-1-phosphate isomerase [Irineochytrium annulatum]
MKVRGAPAIAIVAALSLAVELRGKSNTFTTASSAHSFIKTSLDHLRTSRPTAVNLFEAAARLEAVSEDASKASSDATAQQVVQAYLSHAERMLRQDIEDNRNIGRFGAEYVLAKAHEGDEINIITHCNTGSLATAGWGTALGIIRSLHEGNRLNHVFCTETRPYNQGGRLTAYELVYEKIPSTLITDSMASALMRSRKVAAVVVGADRVAANGDTANKIGTYQLAIVAAYHGVPFIVAAPSTSIDLGMPSGADIHIEERAGNEVTSIRGLTSDRKIETVDIAAPGIGVWNPSFDVTPAKLISAIATEKGIVVKSGSQDVYDMKKSLNSF